MCLCYNKLFRRLTSLLLYVSCCEQLRKARAASHKSQNRLWTKARRITNSIEETLLLLEFHLTRFVFYCVVWIVLIWNNIDFCVIELWRYNIYKALVGFIFFNKEKWLKGFKLWFCRSILGHLQWIKLLKLWGRNSTR